MSNAQNTYNATMTAARAELAAAFEAYNASEWSIEAQVALDAAQATYTAAQYAAQTALTMQSAAEQVAAIRAAEAPARIVEDAIDEALTAIRDAIREGQNAAHLIIKAQNLGATRHDISEVIIEAAKSLA